MVMMTPLSNHAMSLRIAQVPNSLVARALNGLIAEESATATLKMSAQAKINALEKTTDSLPTGDPSFEVLLYEYDND